MGMLTTAKSGLKGAENEKGGPDTSKGKKLAEKAKASKTHPAANEMRAKKAARPSGEEDGNKPGQHGHPQADPQEVSSAAAASGESDAAAQPADDSEPASADTGSDGQD